MNELAKTESKEINLLSKDNFDHYMNIAEKMAKTSMVPKNYINKPMDIIISMQMGMSLGLGMLQSLQDIAVINGKPCLYGDGMLAVVQGHHDFVSITETPLHVSGGGIAGYSCEVRRRGNDEPCVRVFTMEQAKKAGLWGRPGPWTQYPERMLQMRARGFALRDTFADALKGVKSAEEVRDYEIKTINPKSKAEDIISKITLPKVINEETVDKETGEVEVLASKKQVEALKDVITRCNLSQTRIDKALGYYEAKSLDGLTLAQARDFVSKLNKEELNK